MENTRRKRRPGAAQVPIKRLKRDAKSIDSMLFNPSDQHYVVAYIPHLLHERFWTQLFQLKFSLICFLGDNIKMIQLSHSLLVSAATRKTSTGNNFIFGTVPCKMCFLFALKIETSSQARMDISNITYSNRL